MFCKECGSQLADDSKFCPNCGKEVKGIVSVENMDSSPPKKTPVVIIAVGGILACIIAIGIFFTVRNQTDKSAGDEVKESISSVETYESVLNAGTYINESNSITVAKDADGEYSYNLFVYDDTGEYFFFAGKIDNDNGNYLGIISEDKSENFMDKRFSISLPDGDIVISSEDDSLSFICMKYQYSSEVDALEANVSEYEENGSVDSDVADNSMDVPLKDGYYGYWDDDTRYMLAINSDNTFTINVVGSSAPILYGEGKLYYNENDTYKADITACDDDFMNNQTIDILVIDENTLSLSAQYVQLNDAVQGTYQYAGSSFDDVDALRFGNDESANNGTLSQIPYVPITANHIGEYFVTMYDLSRFRRIDSSYIVLGIDLESSAMEDVTVYYSAADRFFFGVKDDMVVLEKIDMVNSPNRITIEELGLPEELYNTEPYICRSGNYYCFVWKLENAYCLIEVIDWTAAGKGYIVNNVFFVADLQYCNVLSNYEPVYE